MSIKIFTKKQRKEYNKITYYTKQEKQSLICYHCNKQLTAIQVKNSRVYCNHCEGLQFEHN